MKHKIIAIVVISSIILFLSSSLRHIFFHSTANDLGIFDQSVYLISQGEKPISSLLGFHILADHAAFIWYPISLFYRIYPSVYWLFAIQSIALSLGAYFVYQLSLQQGLKEKQSLAIAIIYLLYPTIISANLFDFHPDTIALPSCFWLVLIARQANQSNYKTSLIKFFTAILIIVSCKAVLSLTVLMTGIWLVFFEKKRIYGLIAIILGLSWFIISTQFIIPYFGSNAASISRHLTHYSYIGNSFIEIVTNTFFKPQILINHVISFSILFYLLSLILPVIWGLSLKYLNPIICGSPQLLMCILSSNKSFYTVGYQYTLPIVTFLFLAVISNIKTQSYCLKNKNIILILVVLGFLISFNPHIDIGSNIGRDFSSLTYSLQASDKAVKIINELDNLRKDGYKGSVLTTAKIIPHLSHRFIIKLADENISKDEIGTFDYVLLNTHYPILTSSREFAKSLSEELKIDIRYQMFFHENGILLFVKEI
ncbi:putative membrane protein [Pseudanabaena sp. lw0831]|uniref:DUF2079 domain-containing protein n=1 Tax=Pseudanabaena sp. lw0831 TaxID=1357935 RepID=UPI00191520EF|nr:DUF2079 domain-containing protein [Pseudanabaena sp. lw0831]GBO53740.1 putative membrane protein [Pseudanabaena sp. lw0831]